MVPFNHNYASNDKDPEVPVSGNAAPELSISENSGCPSAARTLELLAPAKDKETGIAAINCGADAVYIAGPLFGARAGAGNRIEDIEELCSYAHRFGVRIYLTLNTIIYDNELEEARLLVEQAADAGVDAIIVQDFSLLNEAREKTDSMIDILHRQFREKLHPRTYREILHNAYLNVAKSKRRTAKAVRSLIRRLLCAVKRNLQFVDSYLARGGNLCKKDLTNLGTIRQLYAQQKEMFDKHARRVDNRIVSISQPYIRPIIRGKAKSPVEFGAKYDVSVDEKGHARLEKISFSAYNECNTLKHALERYRSRTGHYPKRVLVDKIYNTTENREYCSAHGIRLSGRGPGRPPKQTSEERKIERKDNVDRNEVERFFSREKRTCGAGLIVTKLEETTLASIALSVLVANLFGIPFGPFFVIFLLVGQKTDEKYHILTFSDDDNGFSEIR